MRVQLKYLLLLLGCGACQAATPAPVTPAVAPAVTSSGVLSGTQPALATPPTPPAIAAPNHTRVILQLRGKGAQIYACRAKAGDVEGFEWALVGPEAELFDAQGKAVLKHSAGPTWESPDGSRVLGKLEAKADAPDADAIPWLLLSAKTSGSVGVLSHVSYVQRVDTQGGKAVPGGCDAFNADAEQRVEYAATYYFYESVPE